MAGRTHADDQTTRPGAPAGAGRAAVTTRLHHRRRALAGGAAAWLACTGLAGCATAWDDVTSREFHVKTMFNRSPEPIVVLRESADGDARAKAMRALKE